MHALTEPRVLNYICKHSGILTSAKGTSEHSSRWKTEKRREAKKSRKNREKAKAEMAKPQEFYAFVLSKDVEIVRRFEAEYQARMTAEEVPEVIEEILDFDTSSLE